MHLLPITHGMALQIKGDNFIIKIFPSLLERFSFSLWFFSQYRHIFYALFLCPYIIYIYIFFVSVYIYILYIYIYICFSDYGLLIEPGLRSHFLIIFPQLFFSMRCLFCQNVCVCVFFILSYHLFSFIICAECQLRTFFFPRGIMTVFCLWLLRNWFALISSLRLKV